MRTQHDSLAVNIFSWNINILSVKLINLKMQLDDFMNGIIGCENHGWKEEYLINKDFPYSPAFLQVLIYLPTVLM